MTQRVFITGGASGLGRAIALRYAKEGAKVCIGDINPEQGVGVEKEITAAGGEGYFVECDVRRLTDFEKVRDDLVKKWGGVDVVVNNAAWRARGELLDISNEAWQHAVDVNVHAPFLMCRAVIPSMVKNLWGRIINYSGIAPFRGASGQGTLKLACEGLTRAIATEYGKYNITANCIGPGSIDVTRTQGQEGRPGSDVNELDSPVPRQGTVEECSAVVVFLASDSASYITGQTYLVNGGAHFL